MPIIRFQSRQWADPPAASCRCYINPPARRRYQIPIAPAATSVPNFPRLRALALFGRRPPQGVEGFVIPASKNLHIFRPRAESELGPLILQQRTRGECMRRDSVTRSIRVRFSAHIGVGGEADRSFKVVQSATAARLRRLPFGDSTAQSALAVLASGRARAQQQRRPPGI